MISFFEKILACNDFFVISLQRRSPSGLDCPIPAIPVESSNSMWALSAVASAQMQETETERRGSMRGRTKSKNKRAVMRLMAKNGPELDENGFIVSTQETGLIVRRGTKRRCVEQRVSVPENTRRARTQMDCYRRNMGNRGGEDGAVNGRGDSSEDSSYEEELSESMSEYNSEEEEESDVSEEVSSDELWGDVLDLKKDAAYRAGAART